jgi:uncharacterized membrane protein YhaH (DUF805 family)
MEDMFRPLRRYASFSGRSRRKEFWLFWLFLVAMLIVLPLVDTALGLGGSTQSYSDVGGGGASVGFNSQGGVLTMIFLLAMLVPMIAVAARRLHDIGKSGWWQLIGIIPLLGGLYLLYLYVQPGVRGPNEYGPDPKGVDAGIFA